MPELLSLRERDADSERMAKGRSHRVKLPSESRGAFCKGFGKNSFWNLNFLIIIKQKVSLQVNIDER
jgi:hypothetical protein